MCLSAHHLDPLSQYKFTNSHYARPLPYMLTFQSSLSKTTNHSSNTLQRIFPSCSFPNLTIPSAPSYPTTLTPLPTLPVSNTSTNPAPTHSSTTHSTRIP